MAVQPSPDADEPLESFYGDEADEVQRLAEASGAGTGPRDPASTSTAGGTRWRTPVTGALMAGIAMGLREVFEPTYHDRIAIEQPAPEQPLEPQKYEVHLDPVAPESSFAIYRPWVDGDDDPDPKAASGPGRRGGGSGGAGALGG